jgi:hypothetical protein
MLPGVLQRSQRLAIGQDNRPIEALIQDMTQPPQQNLFGFKKKSGDSFRDALSHGLEEPIDPSPAFAVPNDGLSDPD